jgi:hypothetical protein
MFPFAALGTKFRGGVASIAVGHVNGDGIPDLVVGAGNGGSSRVEVLNGATGNVLAGTSAYPSIPRHRQAPVRVAVRSAMSLQNNLDNGYENPIALIDAIWTAQGTDGKKINAFKRELRKFDIGLNQIPADTIFENDGDFRGEYFIA